MQHPPITLRYFDARGRGQFLRDYFKTRKVSFTDERVPIGDEFAAWRAMRDDRTRAGPFQKLPVLHWGDRLIPEMLMIAAFVHEASGDAGSLSDEENLRHGLLTSSLCLDMMKRGELLPFPFERAVILLRKEKRYQDELAICHYTAAWAAKSEAEYREGAMIWKSPSIQRVIARRAKLLELIGKDLKS